MIPADDPIDVMITHCSLDDVLAFLIARDDVRAIDTYAAEEGPATVPPSSADTIPAPPPTMRCPCSHVEEAA